MGTLKQFKQHPSIQPFIGEHYINASKKVLVVGESHYYKSELIDDDTTSWYELTDDEFVKEKKVIHDVSWFNTANLTLDVQEKYALGWSTNRAKKIMWIIPRCMYEVKYGEIPTKEKISEELKEISFINFFSRPSNVIGKTLNVTEKDVFAANEKFEFVLKKYSPNVIFFLSKKAYNYLDESIKKEYNIVSLDHPNYYSAWSYRGSGRSYNKAILSLKELYQNEGY